MYDNSGGQFLPDESVMMLTIADPDDDLLNVSQRLFILAFEFCDLGYESGSFDTCV